MLTDGQMFEDDPIDGYKPSIGFHRKICLTLTKHGGMPESFSRMFIDFLIMFWVDIDQKRMRYPNMCVSWSIFNVFDTL